MMRDYVFQCFRDSNASAGSALHTRCWATLSSARELEDLQATLSELIDEGLIEDTGSALLLTAKGGQQIY